MKDFRLRTDLDRVVVDDFEYPLGLVPVNALAPNQGYTVAYTPADEDAPDTYSFHIVLSHPRLRPLLNDLWNLLPREVEGIVEITSSDAYRAVDIFHSVDTLTLEDFLRTWQEYEDILLEEGGIGAGAKGDEPFTEIFVDNWKAVVVHVQPSRREDVEQILDRHGLQECNETWPGGDDAADDFEADVRNVFDTMGDENLEIEQFLLMLRAEWQLILNVDPETNVDDGGRELGLTLWHAIFLIESKSGEDGNAYLSVWATADSLNGLYDLVDDRLEETEWLRAEEFSVSRVAFDERPEELSNLEPRQTEPAIHEFHLEPWVAVSEDEG